MCVSAWAMWEQIARKIEKQPGQEIIKKWKKRVEKNLVLKTLLFFRFHQKKCAQLRDSEPKSLHLAKIFCYKEINDTLKLRISK